MKKFIFGLTVLFCTLDIYSQSVVGGEYFFDTAPTLGNGVQFNLAPTATVDTVLSIQTSALSPGFHNLFMRVKDSSGIWSHYEGRVFYIMPPYIPHNPQIIGGEWFVDTDPGLGNATAFSFAASDTLHTVLNIPTTNLGSGFHNLFFRVKNADGIWSHYEGRVFYIMPNISSSSYQLVSGEWFVDADPGIGNGTSFIYSPTDSINSIFNINTAGLALGSHYLFIRVKNADNKWSLYEGREFTVCNSLLAAPTVVGDSVICLGDTLALNANTVTGATSYAWTGPNGFSASTQNIRIPSFKGSNAGVYYVKAVSGTAACDTGTTASIMVTIDTLPIVTFPNPSSICVGSAPLFLTGGMPAGGTYSGTGVSGGVFDPAIAGVGSHNIIYTYVANCKNSDTAVIVVDICSGITENPEKFKFIVSPNPAIDKVSVVTDLPQGNISLLDILGKKIFSSSVTPGMQEIDIRGLKSGLYFLQLRSAGSTYITKLIIQ